ncbi:MAG: hypothetical protein M1308_17355 [Actinobacteria bacterium]|nr:hypothetical protein [Actinomycetota bacterium]
MEKLYEILVSYEDKSVDLIKLPKEKIEDKINNITVGNKHGKLYVVEIDTLKGTILAINDANVICYYDRPELANIVVKNNKLKIEPENNITFYIEKTIKEMKF